MRQLPMSNQTRDAALAPPPLLRARAIETQTYVIASAQVGIHPGTTRSSWGHALIVDPWGSIVAQVSDIEPYQPDFALADIVSAAQAWG